MNKDVIARWPAHVRACGKVWPENRAVSCARLPGHERYSPVCSGRSRITNTRHEWPTVPDADEPADWQQEGWFETHPNPLPPAPLGWTGDPEPLPELSPSSWGDSLLVVLLLACVVTVLIVVALALAGVW